MRILAELRKIASHAARTAAKPYSGAAAGCTQQMSSSSAQTDISASTSACKCLVESARTVFGRGKKAWDFMRRL